MASGYHLTVKKYLDENRIGSTLPEHIRRGWDRMYIFFLVINIYMNNIFLGIYTVEEQQFNMRSCIIGADVQIPNSIVRQRLGTTQILMKTNIEILRKAFELPDELFMSLSNEHKLFDMIEDDQLSFEWNDEDNNEIKHKKSPISIILNKQREKRRKYEDYKYDYDNIEPLSLNDIIEEIHTNVGQNLNNEDLKLITDLMQIISRHNKNQIINVYDELTNVQLISKFGGIPKLVQALQEIQKAFEQVAMKTNLASIETVIDVLLEKDNTYRLARELLKSFNENIKKTKQQQILKLEDKSGDISDHDQTVFNILMKDRISRLPASELTMLIHNLETIQNIDASKVSNDYDDQVNFISEQLNIIFTRAHLNGIKTVFHTMKTSIGVSLKDFIDKIETSLTTKLTEHDSIIIESYIHDYLTSLTNNELKIVHERLAQQGTLKRIAITGELNQTITLSLMKKIDTNGLGAVIEYINDIQLDNNSLKELKEELMNINNYIQIQSSISLEQIQNQLGMAYFVETRNLSKIDIHELSKAADLYSIVHINLAEEANNDEYTDKKKISTIINEIKQILINVDDRIKQEQLVDLFDRIDITLPERIKRWYKTKSNIQKLQFSASNIQKNMIDGKNSIKTKTNILNSKTKPVTLSSTPSTHRTIHKSINSLRNTLKERTTQDIKDQLPTTTTITSTKHTREQKRSLIKSEPKFQSKVHITKKHSKILDNTKKTSKMSIDKDEKEELKINSEIPLASKSEGQQQSTSDIPHDQPILLPTITTDTINIVNISEPRTESEKFYD
ncbi:unnamed protein product [Rotaria sp. Silwood2]|nr:unnamed protein product [Rotaria sp. Silwood2]